MPVEQWFHDQSIVLGLNDLLLEQRLLVLGEPLGTTRALVPAVLEGFSVDVWTEIPHLRVISF